MQYRNKRALARSQALARNAAQDGVIGAALGLLLVSGLIASNLDMRQAMADSSAPLVLADDPCRRRGRPMRAGAGLCGAALRKFSSLEP